MGESLIKRLIKCFILTLVILGACSKPQQAQNTSSENQLNAVSQNNSIKAMETSSDIEMKISGSWVLYGEDCNSGAVFSLSETHEYGTEEETGNWEIEGQKIVISIKRDGENKTNIYKLNILDIGNTNAILQREDGSNVEWQKCIQIDAITNNQISVEAK